MKKNIEIRLAGFGGQGIILAGYIIGKAAAIFDSKFSTLIQSFGPEARGSSCSAQLLISESQILYPYLIQPNISLILSRDAYERFGGELKSGGTMLIEKDLVQAYVWYRLLEKSARYDGEEDYASRIIDRIITEMDKEQIIKADELVEKWEPTPNACTPRSWW